jgi:hypothetical protein
MRALTRFALLIVLAAAVIPASAREISTVDIVEATTSMLTMPAVADGILVVKTCATCKERSLRATANTRYLIGQQQVSLQQFSAFVRDNSDVFVAVHYDTASTLLLGLKASPTTTSAR